MTREEAIYNAIEELFRSVNNLVFCAGDLEAVGLTGEGERMRRAIDGLAECGIDLAEMKSYKKRN